MTPLEKNLAAIRGEALAANLLATAAIRTALAVTSSHQELLAGINGFIDETLNMSGPAKGDPNDELNTQVREIARFHTMQALDAITRMVGDQSRR